MFSTAGAKSHGPLPLCSALKISNTSTLTAHMFRYWAYPREVLQMLLTALFWADKCIE